jgi:hypothetical protein
MFTGPPDFADMTARNIDFYLSSSASLGTLYRQMQRLALIQNLWERFAPPALAGACRVGACRNHALILFAENGAIASKIKNLVPRLQAYLAEQGIEVTAIRVLVQAPQDGGCLTRQRKAMSVAARQALAQLEGHLNGSPLKLTLRKILKN